MEEKKSNKKIKIPRILYNNTDELCRFFIENKNKIDTHVLNSIEYAINNNLNDIDLFELRFVNDSYNLIVLNMKKDVWEDSIQQFIKEHKDSEQYEKCTPLIKLVTKLKENEQTKCESSK